VAGMIKDKKWRPENIVFPKMGVSPKKVFTFYVGILMQRSLVVSPECIYPLPSAPPNPPLKK